MAFEPEIDPAIGRLRPDFAALSITVRDGRNGPTDAELTRAKNSLSANAIYSRDSQESLANIYGSSLAQGESIDDVVNWPANIEAVTRDDVVALSRQTLDINASVTGWLLPEEGQ